MSRRPVATEGLTSQSRLGADHADLGRHGGHGASKPVSASSGGLLGDVPSGMPTGSDLVLDLALLLEERVGLAQLLLDAVELLACSEALALGSCPRPAARRVDLGLSSSSRSTSLARSRSSRSPA